MPKTTFVTPGADGRWAVLQLYPSQARTVKRRLSRGRDHMGRRLPFDAWKR